MPLGVNAQQRAAFLGDSVTPNTVLQYNKAVFAFLEWVSSSQWELANGPIGTAIALDTAMLDYCIVQYSANPRRGNRQQCVYLKAGIQLHTGLKGFQPYLARSQSMGSKGARLVSGTHPLGSPGGCC